jgi:hypothetical protein
VSGNLIANKLAYCAACALATLEKWKGWPHKDAIPPLQPLTPDVCPACGGTQGLFSTDITWANVHGKHSTGLPDYFVLLCDGTFFPWGYPYFDEGSCPTCRKLVPISEFQRELMYNCLDCGVTKHRHKSALPNRRMKF